jgi:hypothetical protein
MVLQRLEGCSDRRVLDSALLHDAVAAQDTVTLLRGAVRGRQLGPEVAQAFKRLPCRR